MVANMESESLAPWMRRQMARREWTQADLARALGASSGRVSEWLNQKRTPDPESCDRIADVFGADADLVLTLAGHRPAPLDYDPDDWASDIIGRAKRVDWQKPGRFATIDTLLRLYLTEDRTGERQDGAIIVDGDRETVITQRERVKP